MCRKYFGAEIHMLKHSRMYANNAYIYSNINLFLSKM